MTNTIVEEEIDGVIIGLHVRELTEGTVYEFESQEDYPEAVGFNFCSNKCRTSDTQCFQVREDGSEFTTCKNCREGIKEEDAIKLVCNRCTGRTLEEEDFPLKKDGVSRTKSCRFCNENFKR